MEYKVYRVNVQRTIADVEDDLPFNRTETIYSDLLASRKEAIRKAQSKFDRQPINDYVGEVWATVQTATITAKGTKSGKRIYNLFKKRDDINEVIL